MSDFSATVLFFRLAELRYAPNAPSRMSFAARLSASCGQRLRFSISAKRSARDFSSESRIQNSEVSAAIVTRTNLAFTSD
jgi:hypothetical protein